MFSAARLKRLFLYNTEYVLVTLLLGLYSSGELGFGLWDWDGDSDWIRYAFCLLGRSWECVGLRIVRGVRDLRNALGPTRSLDLRHVARYP